MSLVKRNPGIEITVMKPTTPNADPEEHYDRGASNAKTWRGCPGSVNYARQERAAGNIKADDESEYAKEGTTAHGYADDYLTGKITEAEIPATFWEHLQGYVLLAQSLAEEVGGGECVVMNEQKVPYWYRTDKTGTLDYGVIAEDASELVILDLKYGAGVYVTAELNDQGAIYAISTLKKLESEGYVFADDMCVRIMIYQPRHHNFTGDPEVWETTYRELMDMAIDIENDHAKSIAADVTDLRPSEGACQFCDVRALCRQRVVEMFDGVPDEANMLIPASQDLQLPIVGELNDAARVAIFLNGAKIKKWLDDVNKDSLKRIEDGTPIAGMKTVDGKEGNRTWGDNEEDVEKLLRKIPAAKRYKPRRVLSPAQAEKVLKAEDKPLSEQSTKFQNKWDSLIHRKTGTPTLALESDPKPARITGSEKFDDVSTEEVSVDDCF